MKVFNFGSLNIDRVYTLPAIVRPGETTTSTGYSEYCGGKGLNQSVALARAGANVHHAGKVGPDGVFLREYLERAGVDISRVAIADGVPTGHAIIQVDDQGENAIVLFGGANQAITPHDATHALKDFQPGDFLLLQNEISSLPEILQYAGDRELTIVFNPAPMTPEVLNYPLDGVKYFIVNEIEGQCITGEKTPESIVSKFIEKFPSAGVVLTMGKKGVYFLSQSESLYMPGERVDAMDTTGAGDTFTGYFIASIIEGKPMEDCLKTSNTASALCVTRAGAAESIPYKEEVLDTMRNENNGN